MNHKKYNSYYLQEMQIKAFDGFTFRPDLYSKMLNSNLEYLKECQLLKNFNSQYYVEKGFLQRSNSPSIFLYEQHFLNLTTIGVISDLSLLDDQNNRIRKHQNTLDRPQLNHLSFKKEHVGPVVVGYEHDQQIDEILQKVRESQLPFAIWQTVDGREHKLWKISNTSILEEAFLKVRLFYILDGHHRFEAASNYLNYSGSKVTEKDFWIQGLVYSTKYLRTFPQHRKLLKSQSLNVINLLKKSKQLQIKQIEQYEEDNKDLEIVLMQAGRLYHIQETNHTNRLAVEKLDSILKQNLPNFSSKSENQLSFIPSVIFNPNDYRKSQQKEAIFLVKSPCIGKIFQFADRGNAMPPKSTWLEPKPCLHMVVRLPY